MDLCRRAPRGSHIRLWEARRLEYHDGVSSHPQGAVRVMPAAEPTPIVSPAASRDGALRDARRRRSLGWPCLLVVGLALQLLGPPGVSLARPAVSAAVKLKVVRLARLGKQAFARKDYTGAIRHWQAAYGLWPRPQILFNLALAYEKAGEPVKGLTFLREFRREAAVERVPRSLMRAADALERELAPRTAVLGLAAPVGARLRVDGVLVGVVPLEVVLLPGRRALELLLPGRPVVRREVELAAGRATRLEIDVPTPRPAPAPLPPTERPPSKRGLHMVYCLGTAGLAIALAAAASVTGWAAIESYDRFQANPTPTTRDRVVTRRDATNSLWALAGIAGAAAVTLGVFTRWRQRPSPERASREPPRLGLRWDGPGLSLTGTF